MKQVWGFGCLILTILVLSGCSSGNHESVIKETISLMNEMSDVLEQSNTAAEAKPKLETLATRFKDLKQRADSLGKLSKAQDDALKQKYEPEVQKAAARFMAASLKMAQKDPAGMSQVSGVLQGLGK